MVTVPIREAMNFVKALVDENLKLKGAVVILSSALLLTNIFYLKEFLELKKETKKEGE